MDYYNEDNTMKTINDEMIMAYADGELDKEHCSQIESALATDSSLKEKLARHHALRAEFDLAFNDLDKTTIPDEILDLLQNKSTDTEHTNNAVTVTSLVDHKVTNSISSKILSWPNIAIAASVSFAFILGLNLTTPTNTTHSLSTFNAQFSVLLDSTPSGKSVMGNTVKASFLREDGSFCRSFLNQNHKQLSEGLSCRTEDGQWQLVALLPAIPKGVYLPASGESKASISDFTQSMQQLSKADENRYLK